MSADRLAEATERAERLDPMLGSFLHRFPVDGPGPRGPLHGTLIGVKDIVAVAGAPSTCQSTVHDASWWADRDATVVARLRAAGAVIVGKTTMAEHALSRPDPDARFPVPRNPWDPHRWTGGSSCGSANGIPAGFFDAGIGTDSNGSIRIPAALCGVTGLKPTQGLLPTAGVRPLARSVETVGPLARTARECAMLLAVMADRPAELSRPPLADLAGVRVGVPREFVRHAAALTDETAAAFDAALDELRAAGAEVVDVPFDEAFPLFAAQLVTLMVEAFEVHGAQLRARWTDYGRPFRWSVVLGGVLSAETYLRAQRVRGWGADALRARLREVDVIASPTWPSAAPRYDDPASLQMISLLPSVWSAVGFPALALPMGIDGDGLPLSLQLAAAPGRDFELAAVADVYQRRTGWHEREPKLEVVSDLAPVCSPEAPVDGVDPVRRARLAEAVGALGVPLAESDLDQVAMTWTKVDALAGMLPDLPVDVTPIAAGPPSGR
ncbi:amidase [Micromonospora sp. CPCC 205561]|uniref:amidase n=1 Tax=Micromonospora sp. CPCC 205561 TaxID=3122407 RepID=UPI002FF29A2A